MKIGKNGIALIQGFEKCVLHVYDDGYGYPTIGWGHRVKPTDDFSKGITQETADALFQKDINKYVGDVEYLVKVPLNQNQFDALVSFHFNTGALGKSSLLKKVNAGNFKGAANEFAKWVHSDGRVSRGLIRRREAERKLFVTPDSGALAVAEESTVEQRTTEREKAPDNLTKNALETSSAPKTPDNPTDGIQAANSVIVQQGAASETTSQPIVSKPDDPPIEVTPVQPEKTGALKSIWAAICAAVGYIALNVKEIFGNARDAFKDNPQISLLLICSSIIVVVIYWKYQERQTKLDQQRQQQAHELTLEQMRIASDPSKYTVKVNPK